MGLTMVFEPLDYALTAVDVIRALSEGDYESAIGNFILGVTPFVSSKLDDVVLPLLKHADFKRVLPIGSWNMRQREALKHGRITVPGSSGDLHAHLLSSKFETRPPESRYNMNVLTENTPDNKRSANAENIIGEQFRDLDYNVIINPTRLQLIEIGYMSGKSPDFVIEGRVFDAMSVRTHNPRNMVSRLSREKLKRGQADRIILDITEPVIEFHEQSAVSLQESLQGFLKGLRDDIADRGDEVLHNLEVGLDLRELWIRSHDQLFPFLYIENNQIRMLWP